MLDLNYLNSNCFCVFLHTYLLKNLARLLKKVNKMKVLEKGWLKNTFENESLINWCYSIIGLVEIHSCVSFFESKKIFSLMCLFFWIKKKIFTDMSLFLNQKKFFHWCVSFLKLKTIFSLMCLFFSIKKNSFIDVSLF